MVASVIHISTLNEERRREWGGGRGDCRSVTFVLITIVGSKTKSIYLRDFKDVDFNFTHLGNFKFAYFEIEVSFGLISVGHFGQNWIKIIDCSMTVENCHFCTCFSDCGVPFSI